MSIFDRPPKDNKTGVNPADLPPLEPTAEVPPVHSDTLNTPEYLHSKYQAKSAKVPRKERDSRINHNDTRWHEKTAVRVGGAVAALVAVGGTIAGVAASGNDAPNPNETRPTTSAPANPTESAEPTPSETAEAEPTPEVGLVTVEKYPTVEAAAKQLYTLHGEAALVETSVSDTYNYALYGLRSSDWSEANGNDRRWDLIHTRDYARGEIQEANEDLKEAGVTDENGDTLQYWFKETIDKIVRVEGNTVYFKSKIESNYSEMPQYKPELGEAFAYEFATDLPKEGARDNVIEHITLERESGRWIIVDEGFEKSE
jgi:hypothetical protein